MSVESYVVKGVASLNIEPTLVALREMAAGFKGILDQMKSIREMQNSINASMGKAGQAFAEGMERGAKAAAAAATSAEATSKAISTAATAQVQALDAVTRAASARPQQYGPPPLLYLTGPNTGAAPTGANYPSMPPPSVLIPPPPARGFEMQGAPYGPGTALVPVGSAYGGYTGGYDSYAAFRAANGGVSDNLPARWRDPAAGTGFTMGGGRPPPPPDEPFHAPGPVPLYNMPERGDFYAAGYGAQMLGNAAGGLAGQSFMAAAGVDQLKLGLAGQGFTKPQVDQAYAAAVETQKT